MDSSAPDTYTQPDPTAQQYLQQQVRSAEFPEDTSSKPEFAVDPSTARPAPVNSAYIARQQYAQHQRHASTVSMAQATSPSMSLQDGHQNNHHNTPHVKSNPDVPIDPSIAASSPTYPPYSPYTQQGHEMSQYQGHPPPGYQHWPQQYTGHPHGIPNGPYSSPGTAVSAAGAAATAGPRPGQNPHALSQVYSFVPIPGSQQHKRPRRRYEEIERMYKCGWQGCEKAYGTLNHLNAHVTMQSHGAKRTPEEFKEIRKEWKARKKEEDNQRKAADEERRTTTGQPQPDGQSGDAAQAPAGQNYPPGVRPHLPPIGYAPASGQVPAQYPGGVDQMYSQSNGQVYPGYPHSPYGQGQQIS